MASPECSRAATMADDDDKASWTDTSLHSLVISNLLSRTNKRTPPRTTFFSPCSFRPADSPSLTGQNYGRCVVSVEFSHRVCRAIRRRQKQTKLISGRMGIESFVRGRFRAHETVCVYSTSPYYSELCATILLCQQDCKPHRTHLFFYSISKYFTATGACARIDFLP